MIPETILIDDDIDEVSCDGGGGALGHPKVWYTFDGQDSVECGYCDRLFLKNRAAKSIAGAAGKNF
jgi:uncharacterized Zn-finger protein